MPELQQAPACPFCSAAMTGAESRVVFGCLGCGLSGTREALARIEANRKELGKLRAIKAAVQLTAELRRLAKEAEVAQMQAEADMDTQAEQWNRGKAVAYKHSAKLIEDASPDGCREIERRNEAAR